MNNEAQVKFQLQRVETTSWDRAPRTKFQLGHPCVPSSIGFRFVRSAMHGPSGMARWDRTARAQAQSPSLRAEEAMIIVHALTRSRTQTRAGTRPMTAQTPTFPFPTPLSLPFPPLVPSELTGSRIRSKRLPRPIPSSPTSLHPHTPPPTPFCPLPGTPPNNTPYPSAHPHRPP